MFFARGFSSATVDDIARQAELAKGTIYRYFPTKTDVYLGIAARGLDTLITEVRRAEVSKQENAEDAVKALLLAYARFSDGHRGYFDAFSFFSASEIDFADPSESLLECAQRYEILHAEVQRLLDDGHTAGFWPKITDAPKVAALIAMLTTGFLSLLNRRAPFLQRRFGAQKETLLNDYVAMLQAYLKAFASDAN